MNRRRTLNDGNRHTDRRTASPHPPDNTSVHCVPEAEDLNGPDFNQVDYLPLDTRDLRLTHNSRTESCMVRGESSNLNIRKGILLPSPRLKSKEKPRNLWRQQGKQAEYIAEQPNGSLHFVESCTPDAEHIDESSRSVISSSKDRLLDLSHQFRKSSGEKACFKDETKTSHYCYDICPPRNEAVIILKSPLHVRNRELRNENKRCTEGLNISVLRPGMVLLKSYLSFNDQVKIVKSCRELGIGPGGFYQPGYHDGAILNLKMMCLGKNWDPESNAYGNKRRSDGAKPPLIPHKFSQLVKGAIKDSHVHLEELCRKRNVEDILPSMSPNICIVNFYSQNGKLGLHQDKDETQESLCKGLPVVSFSIGDSAEFLYGDERDVCKSEKTTLESGDVLIFGGKSRHIYHGVSAIHPQTASKALLEETNLRPGRLNLTFREY